jgi:hypothetical protein
MLNSFKITDWLPTTKKEVAKRGWEQLDVILFSGDAYVDHPAFGAAVIGRIIESMGMKIAIVPQPNWQDDLRDFKKLGTPRLFFWCYIRLYGFDGQSLHGVPSKTINRCLQPRRQKRISPRLHHHGIYPNTKEIVSGCSGFDWWYRSFFTPGNAL